MTQYEKYRTAETAAQEAAYSSVSGGCGVDFSENMVSGKNFQADSKWQELKPLLIGVDTSILLQIDHSLEQFDYTTALELLAEMVKNDEIIQ